MGGIAFAFAFLLAIAVAVAVAVAVLDAIACAKKRATRIVVVAAGKNIVLEES